jgi:DNA-binding CsgD family transcriptional regulator
LIQLKIMTKHKQQIMRCVHMGSTNKMIARTLGISEGTVKIHLASIFQLLGAANRAAAVAIYNGVQNAHLEILRAEKDELEARDGRRAQTIHPNGQAAAAPQTPTEGETARETTNENDTATVFEEALLLPPPHADEPARASADSPLNDTATALADESSSEAHAPLPETTDKTNVIPLRAEGVVYPPLNEDTAPPLPMAAQPESSF